MSAFFHEPLRNTNFSGSFGNVDFDHHAYRIIINCNDVSSIRLNHLNAHTLERIRADSVVVITRRCQRLNPGSSPGRRTFSLVFQIFVGPENCGSLKIHAWERACCLDDYYRLLWIRRSLCGYDRREESNSLSMRGKTASAPVSIVYFGVQDFISSQDPTIYGMIHGKILKLSQK